MTKEDLIKYWSNDTLSSGEANHDDKLKAVRQLFDTQTLLANPYIDYNENIIAISKEKTTTSTITMNTAAAAEDELGADAKKILDEINDAAKDKYIEMFYATYMGESNSDLLYRLGEVSEHIADIPESPVSGAVDGRLYSRSDFGIRYTVSHLSQGKLLNHEDYYVNMAFPPYLNDSKELKAAKKSEGGLTSFDKEYYMTEPTDYCYRDPAFKQINDYIIFIQSVAARATGIYSTVLSEWDLSLYMQEKFIAPGDDNNVTLSINHNIIQDNPCKYTQADDAFVYNVTGCAVSKMPNGTLSINAGTWSPAKHHMTPWWISKTYDWNNYTRNENGIEIINTNYLSCFDESTIFLDSMTPIEIVNKEDAIATALSCKHSNTLHYYDAFYTSSADGLTQADITRANFITVAAGMKGSGTIDACCSKADLIAAMKADNIADGGVLGECSLPGFGTSGGVSKEKVKDALVADGLAPSNGPTVTPTTKYYSSEHKLECGPMTGLNRFSPALFGGPHSAEYDPNHYRAFFNPNSELLRNVPRMTLPDVSSFSDVEKRTLYRGGLFTKNYEGCSSFYKESPADNLYKLLKGRVIYNTEKMRASIMRYTYMPEIIDRKDKSILATDKDYQAILPTKFDDYAFNILPGMAKVPYVTTITMTKIVYDSLPTESFIKSREISHQVVMLAWVKVQVVSYMHYGWYTAQGNLLFKVPELYNKPRLEWSIRAYNLKKFRKEDTSAVTSDGAINNRDDHTWTVDKDKKTAYILDLGSDAARDAFIDNYLMRGQNTKNPEKEIYFLCGNKNKRFSEGPNSIFKAKCKVDWFKTTSFKYITLHILWFTIRIPYDFTVNAVPLIFVDLPNVTEYYSGLSKDVKSNILSGYDTGVPIHLRNDWSTATNLGYYYNNPIQEMISGDKASIVASHTENGDTVVDWSADSNFSISGFGMVTQLPGIDGSLENISAQDNYFDYGNTGRFSNQDMLNVSFDSLTGYWRDAFPKNSSERKDLHPDDYHKYTKGKLPTTRGYSVELDAGFLRAWVRACTRSLFKPVNLTDAKGGVYIDSAVPFRVLTSMLAESLSGIQLIKDVVGLSMNLNAMPTIMINLIEGPVLAANGLLKDGTRVSADKNSVFYDYWLAKFIDLTSNPSTGENNIEKCLSIVETTCKDILDKLLVITQKDMMQWTYMNFMDACELMKSLQSYANRINDADVFIMGYLKVLYYWRLSFIALRFNKVDGTMWRMRALESTINIVAAEYKLPENLGNISAKNRLSVKFHRLQNTPAMKADALLNKRALPADRHQYVYVLVEYGTENDYNLYTKNSSAFRKVIKLEHNGVTKYAFVPEDGEWTYVSKEYLADVLVEAKKAADPTVTEPSHALTECKFSIKWDPNSTTPIKFDMFNDIDVVSLLTYSSAGVSGNDLLCMAEETADFWEIEIPDTSMPLDEYWQTGLRLVKDFTTAKGTRNDIYNIMLGPLARTISPIGNKTSYEVTDSIQSIVSSKFELS